MNLLLLDPAEVQGDGTALLQGRRLTHAREVLKSRPGDTLRVGVRGGRRGTATVATLDAQGLKLALVLDGPPPPRAGIDVLLAVPRPKALKKVLPALASLGIDRLVLLNAAKVDKAYFQSPVLKDQIAELFDLGLEQARDTVPPELLVRERFRPFVEDELPTFCAEATVRRVAHPTPEHTWPTRARGERAVIAIGPEGGWVPFELELLQAQGFALAGLGPRSLRVEVAVPALVAALGPL